MWRGQEDGLLSLVLRRAVGARPAQSGVPSEVDIGVQMPWEMILREGKGQTLGDVCIPGTGIEKGGNASGKDVREGT